MGDVNHLNDTEAIAKIKELSDEIGICMFCTYTTDNKLESRPMSALKVDDVGNIWFLSDNDSRKNRSIEQNDRVELFYSSGRDCFMSVHGVAKVYEDKEVIRQLWVPLAKVWFEDGIDDNDISAIRVTPKEGYYWDSKHGSMVQFAKLAASLVTGKTMDDGIEGTLKP